MIDQPGIYSISADEYHRDPCVEPSLSAGTIKTLLAASPAHARHEHPRLNPFVTREDSEKFDKGHAAHAFILEGHSAFEIITADDWRTKAAREARDTARAAGKTPLLEKHWADVMAMAEAIREELSRHEDPPTPLTDGKPEQTIVWREQGIWLRARLDWLHDDFTCIDDLKTSSALVNPETYGRKIWADGFDIQASLYIRGLRAVTGKQATFRFVAVENTPPFAMSVLGLAPLTLALAERKVERAISLWAKCLSTNSWPSYPRRTCYVETPPWEEARLMAAEELDGASTDA